MDLIMRETIIDQSPIGRTRQEFLKGSRYDVPDRIAQIWIGRGWAWDASMAKGGIVTRPTLALMGVEAGPEAFLPIDRRNGNGRKE